jgi:hypothetical protein
MTDIPADWILIEAAKRCDMQIIHCDLRELRLDYAEGHAFRALCDMIQKYEQPPVDRKLLCAREAVRLGSLKTEYSDWIAIRAIELWEEGFGRD